MSRDRLFRIVAIEERREASPPLWLDDDGEATDHAAEFWQWTQKHRDRLPWTPWGSDTYTVFAYLLCRDPAAHEQIAHEARIELYEIARSYGIEVEHVVDQWRAITRCFRAIPPVDAPVIHRVSDLIAEDFPTH